MQPRRRSCFAAPLRAGVVAAALLLAGQAHAEPASRPATAAATGATTDPDSFLMNPAFDGDPRTPPRFRAARPGEDRLRRLPSFSYRPAFGAGATGFDSTNARKRKSAQPAKPGGPADLSPRPKDATASPDATRRADASPKADAAPGADPPPSPKRLQPASAPLSPRTLIRSRAGAPPAAPDGDIATIATIPPFRRPPPEEKPFDPLGIQVGAFNIRPAVDYTRGFDNNPERNATPPKASSWFNLYATEVLANSNWERHELAASLRGSYITYDTLHSLDRPDLAARVNGRIDVTGNTRVDLEGRYLLFTDRPGSPNIQAGLARLPFAMTEGGTAGIAQRFNRLDVTLKESFDRTTYNDSLFTDGTTASNDGRNFNRYFTQLRTGYEVTPGIKPFVEAGAERRAYDLLVDAGGNNRSSDGLSGKAGTTFEMSRKLVGEVAFGYLARNYRDPMLENIRGWTTDGSLVWLASALTTFRLGASTGVAETTLPNVSGAFMRDITAEVNHAFRRWLIATLKFTRGVDDYVGSPRVDHRYIVSTALAYYLSRELQLKGEYRQDWRRSNIPGNDYVAHIWLVGLRLQR